MLDTLKRIQRHNLEAFGDGGVSIFQAPKVPLRILSLLFLHLGEQVFACGRPRKVRLHMVQTVDFVDI